MLLVPFVSWTIGRAREARSRGDQTGTSLVEYALLLLLIVIVAFVALHFLGGTVSNGLNNDVGSINNQ